MSATALRPRSTTEIVDAAFQIFRANAGPLIMGAALFYVPVLLLQLLLIGNPARMQAAAQSFSAEFGTYYAISMLLGVVSYATMTAVLTVLTSQAYLGEPVDVGTATRRALPRVLAVLLAAVLVWLLVFVGMIFLIIPGLWLALRYFAVTPAILLENRGALAAMGRSAELSKGRKWHIFLTILLILVIYFVIFMGVSLVATLLGGVWGQMIGGAVLTVVLYPVIAVTMVLLYYDARIQSEGLDIELMAGALGPDASPAV